ncbi:MAG: FCD domain-containing protein [Gemmataceae bacterium]|nr:FCD domain-containing protein [Gemmataceae bacterium]
MNGKTTATILARPDSAEDVVQALRGVIQERGLKVGDQLPSIRELAEQLDAKPTTVRDALLRAQATGLVRVLPRAGAFVRAIPAGVNLPPALPMEGLVSAADNLFHVLDARRLIEIELVGRAAERRRLEDLLPVRRALEAMIELPDHAPRTEYVEQDIHFHIEIARLAGNAVLFAMQHTLMERLRSHLNNVPRPRERRGQTDRSHAAIYAALVAGNVEQARTEMRQHLSMAYDSLLRDLQAPPAVGKRRA